MITQTIQSLAVTMSEGGYGNYVIVDLQKATSDDMVPEGLPHGVAGLVGVEKTAIEFPVDEDEDQAHARTAYSEIVDACRAHASNLRGSVTLVEDGEVETAAIG